MEQYRKIGEVLGALKALMVFQDDILINRRQCGLLVDIFHVGFDVIAEEIRHGLKYSKEALTKWKALEQPLREIYRVFIEGKQYVEQCLETKNWLVKAVALAQNTDCIEFHLHNLLSCIPIMLEAIEVVDDKASGCEDDEIRKKRLMFTKKYAKEWMDPLLFQHRFGNHYLVSNDICSRIDTVWREDRWILLEILGEKTSSCSAHLREQELRIAELLLNNLDGSNPSKGKLFSSFILVGSEDYQVKGQIGNCDQYKEIQWMGECFTMRRLLGDIQALVPEISHLSSFSHPNIMHVLCAFSDEEKTECFLVMELMNKDLRSSIKEICSSPKKSTPFSLPVAVDIMIQIARGMNYLHSRKIYHGDLNPSNILIKTRNSTPEGYLHIKVAGYGFSSVKNSSPHASMNQTDADPFIWNAPEVLSEQEQDGCSHESKYTEKADVYSFGMICFEVLTGKIPFEESHLQGEKMSMNIRAGERPLFPFSTPKYLTNITKKCWQTDPLQRPTFSSICRMLRYIKRFLIMNPNHSEPDAPMPAIDYSNIEMGFSQKFSRRTNTETVSNIPFQMFAYRVIEEERTTIRDQSSESESEEASVGAENTVKTEAMEASTGDGIAVKSETMEASAGNESTVKSKEPFRRISSFPSMSLCPISSKPSKKMLKNFENGIFKRNSGKYQNGGNLTPPQLLPRNRSLRTSFHVN